MRFPVGGKIIAGNAEACSRDLPPLQSSRLHRDRQRLAQGRSEPLVPHRLVIATARSAEANALARFIGDQRMSLGRTDIEADKVFHAPTPNGRTGAATAGWFRAGRPSR